MSDPAQVAADTPADPIEQAREQVDRTREEFGLTLEALAAKADVKQRAKDKARDLTRRASDAAPDSGRTAMERMRAEVLDHPGITAALIALIVGVLLGRRLGRR